MWKQPNYSLLANETGQPLFYTLTDDHVKCVEKVEPTAGGPATADNVGLKLHYV